MAGWDGLLDQAQSTTAAALSLQDRVPSKPHSALWLRGPSSNLFVHVISPSIYEVFSFSISTPLLTLNLPSQLVCLRSVTCPFHVACIFPAGQRAAAASDATWSRTSRKFRP